MSTLTIKQPGFGFFLLASLAVAFATVFTFMVAFYFSLDLEHRQWVLNSFILLPTFFAAAVSGLLASPLLFFCLRRKRLSVALPIVIIPVLTMVAALTPFSESAGLGGACVMFIISVLICTLLPNRPPEPLARGRE
jgi:hypothetical protein